MIGSGQSFANPSDDDPVTVNNPFQAANCANLAFKPLFKVSTSGKTSRKNGASLAVKLSYPTASLGKYANIAKVKVSLPKQLPSASPHCSKHARARSSKPTPQPVPQPRLWGTRPRSRRYCPYRSRDPPISFRHGGAKFPELIIVLQGYGVTIDLHGETFISKAGITSSTFATVPDQPVTSFELTLPQGPNSALAANGNLCAASLKMPTLFTAQNGATIKRTTPIATTGCPKHKHKKKKTKKANRTRRHHKGTVTGKR